MFRPSLIFAAICYSSLACIQSARICEAAVLTAQCGPPLLCGPAPSTPQPSLNSQTVSIENKQSKPDTFSELTLFLFGSGVALFVALLGWSDQIRSINKDTRELEERFLAATKINRRVFLSVVKPDSPDDQLAALTEILASGKPKTAAAVEVLKIFKTWHEKWTNLETLSAWKYRLAVALTYVLFAAGLLSLLVDPHVDISVSHFRVRALLVILVFPMVGILAILTIIAVANYKEAYFRELLNSISEKV